MGPDENDIGIDVDDLVQEGRIGLLNAIPLFDTERSMNIWMTFSQMMNGCFGAKP